jgi:redox-sensitive bicupin YhaK (pirin superfamily)
MSANPKVDPVVTVSPLGFPWPTRDPFLTCVHHVDHYPRGNDRLGPAASLADRNIGQDFARKDGWRMYHGHDVPGFPQRPHRGFETVTFVRQGYIDHSDSLGATARFGRGDVQWLTAGAGIVHSEMFPLLDASGPNPLELFQIWLNLPARNKMADPYFTMFWDENVPRRRVTGASGNGVEVTIVAGALGGIEPPPPPPHSWAASEEGDVAIWSIALAPGASWTLPPARDARTVRTLYLFSGRDLRIGERTIADPAAIEVVADRELPMAAGDERIEILVLQGRPIAEPVAQYGPFVMNTRAELEQAFYDYRRTQFGGWPYKDDAPVFGRERGRFAKHADGRVEEAPVVPELRSGHAQ